MTLSSTTVVVTITIIRSFRSIIMLRTLHSAGAAAVLLHTTLRIFANSKPALRRAATFGHTPLKNVEISPHHEPHALSIANSY